MPLSETDATWVGKHLIVTPETTDRWARLSTAETIGATVAHVANIVADVERQLADEKGDAQLDKRRRGYRTIALRRLRDLKALQKEVNVASDGRIKAHRKGLQQLMAAVDALIEGDGTQRDLEDTFHLVGDALEAVGIDLERGGYLS